MKGLFSRIRKIIDPAVNERGHLQLYALNIFALFMWSVFIGVAVLYFGRANYDLELFFSYFAKPVIAALNITPFIIITATLYLITGRAWAAFLGCSLLGLVPALVNYYKIALRGDPLTIADVALIFEAAEFGGNYSIEIYPVMWLTLAVVISGVLAAALLLRMRVRVRVRLPSAAVVIAVGIALYNTVYTSVGIFHYTAYNMDIQLPSKALSEWSLADQFASRGFLYPFIYSSTFSDTGPPEGYLRGEARDGLEAYGYSGIPDGKEVNVIAVMLEAFSDLTVFDEIDFVRDPTPFLHGIQKESVSGNLITNVFAGGTTDTERTFLTGGSELHNPRRNTGSYVRYFADQGYRAEYCHPGVSWVYNRANVSEYLGFENAYFQENRYDYYGDGTMILDDLFFPDILTLLDESVAAGEPYFNFSLTYQNHAPYADGFLYTDEVFAEKGGLSEEAYNILTNYLWSISLTDAALEKFVNELENRDDPVAVVFFGDHKPWLGDGAFVYDELGISFEGSEGLYNKYSTPYVIWANSVARETLGVEFAGNGGDISPMFLMPLLFDCLGWEGDEFMKAEHELRNHVDIVHSSGAVRENGVLTSEPSGEAAAALDMFLKMEYYRRRDALYR